MPDTSPATPRIGPPSGHSHPRFTDKTPAKGRGPVPHTCLQHLSHAPNSGTIRGVDAYALFGFFWKSAETVGVTELHFSAPGQVEIALFRCFIIYIFLGGIRGPLGDLIR